jgi:hypothetical protein
VTFTKFLTIYHSWIHPLHHSPLSIPGIVSTCQHFHTWLYNISTTFILLHPFLMSFPSHWYQPPDRFLNLYNNRSQFSMRNSLSLFLSLHMYTYSYIHDSQFFVVDGSVCVIVVAASTWIYIHVKIHTPEPPIRKPIFLNANLKNKIKILWKLKGRKKQEMDWGTWVWGKNEGKGLRFELPLAECLGFG